MLFPLFAFLCLFFIHLNLKVKNFYLEKTKFPNLFSKAATIYSKTSRESKEFLGRKITYD